MINFLEALRQYHSNNNADIVLRIEEIKETSARIYVHPSGFGGKTYVFNVLEKDGATSIEIDRRHQVNDLD